MAAVRKESLDQFRVQFAEVARARRGEPVQVDPYLIARAIAAVMGECTVRTAAGRSLLWNEYRLILARRDFELIRALQGPLERDLQAVLTHEVRSRQAELAGELRVTVVVDESDELVAGEGVVRVGFVPTAALASPRAGDMTVRFDGGALADLIGATPPAPSGPPGSLAPPVPSAPPGPPSDTVFVDDATDGPATRCVIMWPGGWAQLSPGATLVGRPHLEAPPRFIGLTGASARINKRHFWLALSSHGVRIGRLPEANPVHVNGQLLAPSQEMDLSLPAEISLSRGELVLTLRQG